MLFRWPHCQVLLHRNAAVPWLILVPETEAEDLLELPQLQRHAVMDEAAAAGEFIQQYWGLRKINFAQLGNVVPQMHLHVIGRSPADPCWPRPIWGNLPETKAYSSDEVQTIAARLQLVLPGNRS